MHVNLAPLVDGLASLFLLVLTSLVPILLPKALKLLGVSLDAGQRKSLQDAIDNSIGQALAVAKKAGDSNLSDVTIRNLAVGQATQYVLTHAPDAVAHFGLSAQDVAQKVDGAVEKHLNVNGQGEPVEASPAAAQTSAKVDKALAPVEPIVPASAEPTLTSNSYAAKGIPA